MTKVTFAVACHAATWPTQEIDAQITSQNSVFILLSVYAVTRGLLGLALNALLFVCLLALLIAVAGRARRSASIPRIGMVSVIRATAR